MKKIYFLIFIVQFKCACKSQQFQNNNSQAPDILQNIFANGGDFEKFCPILDSVFFDLMGNISCEELDQLDLSKIKIIIKKKKEEIIRIEDNFLKDAYQERPQCNPASFELVMRSCFLAKYSKMDKIRILLNRMKERQKYPDELPFFKKFVRLIPLDSIFTLYNEFDSTLNVEFLYKLSAHPEYQSKKFEIFTNNIINSNATSATNVNLLIGSIDFRQRIKSFNNVELLKFNLDHFFKENGQNKDSNVAYTKLMKELKK